MPTYNNPYLSGVTNYPTYSTVGQTGVAQLPINNYTVPQQVTPVVNSGIIWVQGEAGAKAYPVASGGSVLLMDSESENFYIKSTDISGMPMPLRVFKYEEVTKLKDAKDVDILEVSSKPDIDLSKYVTYEELDKRLSSHKNSKYENKKDRRNIDE